MKEVLVNITQQHIGDGIQSDRCSCAVALAIKEATSFYYVAVGAMTFDYQAKALTYPLRMELSPKVMDFIEKFDDGDPVSPMSFTLNFDDAKAA